MSGPSGDAEGFVTLDVREPYAGRSTVRIETVRFPDGSEAEREVVGHDDAVAIVPVTDDGRLLLLRQYRHPLRGHVLEIPAGTLDVEGESPEGAAHRELAEETGHHAERLEHLVTLYNSAGWTDERTHVYLGHGVTLGRCPDDFEAEHEEADMEILSVAFDEAVSSARRGEITDAKTLVGLLLAADRPR